MRRFAALYDTLDRTTSTDAKVAAMRAYFETAPPADAAWGLYFLTGRKLKRLVRSGDLSAWCMAEAGVPDWLFGESYTAVGDLAETIALLMDAAAQRGDLRQPEDAPLAEWVEARLLPMRGAPQEAQRELVAGWWRSLPRTEIFLLNKMMTGALRVGVSRTLVVRALAEVAGVEQAVMSHRLMGEWEPSAGLLRRIFSGEEDGTRAAQPYPFYLASPVLPPDFPEGWEATEDAYLAEQLGDPAGWLAEWKWDGIRGQLIKRAGVITLWSRGDEDLTERFPEIVTAAARLPEGTVLDGEVLCWDFASGRPLDFGVLQTRIGRKTAGPTVQKKAPAAFMAYDLLEHAGEDLRGRPIEDRASKLADLGIERPLLSRAPFGFESWEGLAAQRGRSRERGVEGLMLKRRGSPYCVGRVRGDWWKWKVEPLTVDAVLVYAQPGHGRRASLLTDYTFAVWDGERAGEGELVPVAKAYSGLTDAEIRELDAWIRRHTVERFGPVRHAEPEQVFELAFDSVRLSNRHKSGVAMRFPRMKRWRKDKPPAAADTLAMVRGMIGYATDGVRAI